MAKKGKCNKTYTIHKKTFNFIPGVGVGPFLFWHNIYTCNAVMFPLYLNKSDLFPADAFRRTYYLDEDYLKLAIFTNEDDIIESLNSDILYYRGKNLVGKHIKSTQKILGVTEWDDIEEEYVLEQKQILYCFDEFNMMLWTYKNKVKNIAVYDY